MNDAENKNNGKLLSFFEENIMEPRNTIGVGESQPCGSRHR
jgi:hypothetical protein